MLAIVLLLVIGLSAQTHAVQQAWGVNELSEYRLTVSVFRQFQGASRLIAAATRDDPAFLHAPLFTREIVLSGDVQEMAIVLEARLTNEPPLVSALRETGMSAREYTKFALVLVAAHFAHGFVEAGVLRRVPDGAAADNVAFVGAHQQEIQEVLKDIVGS